MRQLSPSSAAEIPGTLERGSFTHGVCLACGWRGPARRSRDRARRDAAAHTGQGCVSGQGGEIASSQAGAP